jgi:hypothetical protein
VVGGTDVVVVGSVVVVETVWGFAAIVKVSNVLDASNGKPTALLYSTS